MNCTYKDIEAEFESPNYYTIDEFGNPDQMLGMPNQIAEVREWLCHNCGERFDETKLISQHVELRKEKDV